MTTNKNHRKVGIVVSVVIMILTLVTPLNSGYIWHDLFYCFLAFATAYWLPDSDQHVKKVTHRWFGTHSCIAPFVVFLLFRSLAGGVFALVYASHLFADLKKNPNDLVGFGAIHFNVSKTLKGKSAGAWLFFNGLISMGLGIIMVWFRF